MSMKYVRDRYAVPAKRGRRVQYYDKDGVCEGSWRLRYTGRIMSARQGYLWIRVPTIGRIGPFHPTCGLVYLDDDGRVLLDTRESQP